MRRHSSLDLMPIANMARTPLCRQRGSRMRAHPSCGGKAVVATAAVDGKAGFREMFVSLVGPPVLLDTERCAEAAAEWGMRRSSRGVTPAPRCRPSWPASLPDGRNRRWPVDDGPPRRPASPHDGGAVRHGLGAQGRRGRRGGWPAGGCREQVRSPRVQCRRAPKGRQGRRSAWIRPAPDRCPTGARFAGSP